MKNLILSFLSRGLSVVLAFIFSILLTRTLPQADVGLYLTGITIMNGLSIVVKFGFDTHLIKISANLSSNSKFSIYCNLVIYTLMTFSIVGGILYFVLADSDKLGLYQATGPFILSAWFVSLFGLTSAYLRSLGRVPLANFIEVGAVPLILVFIYSFFQEYISFHVAVWTLLFVVLALAVVICLFLFTKNNINVHLFLNFKKNDLVESFNVMMASISDFLLLWLAAFFVAIVSSPSEAAQFQIALRLSLLMIFILIVLSSITAPIIASHVDKNEYSKLSELLQVSSSIGFSLGLPPLVIILFFPDFLLNFFGQDYLDAAPVLIILAIGQFIHVITGLVHTVLIMSGNAKFYFKYTVYGVMTAFILGVLLIPEMGGLGAAISTLGAILVRNIFCIWYGRKVLALTFLPSFYGFKMIIDPDRLRQKFSHQG